MIAIEEWTAVEGFPGYSVNPLGEVRRDATGRVIHTRQNEYGVPYIGLMRDGKQRIRSLPKLVATAFVPKRNPVFDTPINLDGNRTNCHVDNLMWRPRWFAVHYVNQFENRYDYVLPNVREVETGEEFADSLAAACRFGLLERDLVLSILNHTLVWPTFQQFELVE